MKIPHFGTIAVTVLRNCFVLYNYLMIVMFLKSYYEAARMCWFYHNVTGRRVGADAPRDAMASCAGRPQDAAGEAAGCAGGGNRRTDCGRRHRLPRRVRRKVSSPTPGIVEVQDA